MFNAYADGQLFYSPRLVDEGLAIAEPKCTVELNKAGSFTFDLPSSNPFYNRLHKMKTIITLKDDNEIVWKGRVLNDDRNFYNTKSVVCEGECAFLNDIEYPPHDHSKKGIKMGEYFKKLIDYYASECSASRMLKTGTVKGGFADVLIYPKTSEYTNIWNLVSGNIIGASNGKVGKNEVDLSEYDRYLRIRRVDGVSYLDLLEDIGERSGQTIEFGKNLLDLSEYIDASNVYTYIIPLGKMQNNGKRVDIKSKTGGNNYLRSEVGENLFGKIQKSVIWEDETSPTNLMNKGKAKLEKAIKMATKITIRAFDLHLIDVNTDNIRVGDTVRVVSVPHGIDSDFLCSKISCDIQNPENTEYTFGLDFETLTGGYASYKQTNDYKIASALEQGEENAQGLVDALKTMGDLQTQVDGNITSWFYPGVPTANNYPASEWNTPELKAAHLGDLYYDKDTGIGYRWTASGDSYTWETIKDAEVGEALRAAANAQATADGKIRCFTVTPFPPYEVGDLWAQGASGDMLSCNRNRVKGEKFNAADWVKTSKYTDDSYAHGLETALNTKIGNLSKQLDGKVELWFYGAEPTTTNVPAKNWTTDTLKNQHIDDLYYNTANGKCYRWTKNGDTYRWELVRDADIAAALKQAQNAQAAADGKIRCFTDLPTPPYDKGDLWTCLKTESILNSVGNGMLSFDFYQGELYRCVTDKKKGESFYGDDWQKATHYTDDTRANEASKTATDYITDDGKGNVNYGTNGSGTTTNKDGLQLNGVRNMTPIWDGRENTHSMSAGTVLCRNALITFTAVAIGCKECYTSPLDSSSADGDLIQYTIIPVNGQEARCTYVWDKTRIRKVTVSKTGITVGAGGWYTSEKLSGSALWPWAGDLTYGAKFNKNDKCCVPVVVYGFL